MKLRKILLLISSVSLFMAFIALCLFFFWLIYPYKPLVFKTEKFKVQNPIVRQGDNLLYTSDYCKYSPNTYLVSRTFENSLVFSTPAFISNRPLGCKKITVGVLVPPELPPGKYILINKYQTELNPIRTLTIEQRTEEFTVIER
jgi:hypothetical protein